LSLGVGLQATNSSYMAFATLAAGPLLGAAHGVRSRTERTVICPS
jgi:hypothetical protein